MPKTETTATRAPRGTKPVSQAFFTALAAVPEAARSAVGKAALGMIRDELKARQEKIKASAAREKARKPPAPKRAAKPATTTLDAPAPTAASPKRRSRKQTEAPASS
jgi:hypothetical protein